jgi:hypothetical protein
VRQVCGAIGAPCILLRDRFENSNFILVKIPIEIHNLGHGEKLTCMDSGRLPAELGLADHDILSLSERGLIRPRPQKPRQKKRIDHTAPECTPSWVQFQCKFLG